MPATDPARFNLAAYVLHAGAATPDKVALAILTLTGAERWSYGRLIQAVRGCGSWLLDQGISPGERLLIRLGNSPAWPVLYLGAIAAGIVPVSSSPLLGSTEITAMARQIGARVVVADPGIAVPEGAEPLMADLAAWERSPPCDFAFGDAGREAYLVFTSGTTGRPLAVRHAHRAILARSMMHEAWEGISASDRLLHSGAFNWTYTLGTGLMDPWSVGATALIPAASVSHEHLGLVLRRHDATILATVPTVLRRLLRGPLPALPRLRHALCAGEALPPALRREWQERTGTDVHEAFGMSEISTFISGSPARPAPEGTSGFPQPGRRIAILGEAGQLLPPGEQGILAISTDDPGLMLSYDGEAAPGGKWFATGDLVHQDHRGAVHYHGRNDEMMNPGGIRVSPREVEMALSDLPGVTDLAVTEVSPAPGLRIIACFYAGETVPESLANDFAAERLARYKTPRVWIPVSGIPRGPTGKLLRSRLQALYQEMLAKACE